MLGAILQISKCYIFAITQTAMQRVESVQELLGLGSQKNEKKFENLEYKWNMSKNLATADNLMVLNIQKAFRSCNLLHE